MSSPEQPHGDHAFYKLTLDQTSSAILRATLTKWGKAKNKEFGDDADRTFNLSDTIGNNDGAFEWGGHGFQKSSRGIKVLEGTHTLVAELQDMRGEWHHRCMDLDETLDLKEYVHSQKRVTFSRLAAKTPPPTKVRRPV
jgi:hypothetical protein